MGGETSRRPRLALAVPVEPAAGAVPDGASGLVLLLAGTRRTIVPFLLS